MFGRIRAAIRSRIASYIDDGAADLRRELRNAEQRCNNATIDRDGLAESVVELRKAIEFCNATRQQTENALTVLESNFDALTEQHDSLAEQLKSADAAAQTLREELAAERKELEDVRQDLARTEKQLELASQENRLLSEIHETDVQRRVKEREIEQSQAAIAIADARRYANEQHLEAA